MGRLEREARKKRQKDYVQKAVLAAIQISGLLALAAVAPNTLQLLGKLHRKNYRFNYQSKTVLSRLAAKGYVQFVEKGGKKSVTLTPLGQQYLDRESFLSDAREKKPWRWDKRWRLVMFDIPERRRGDRERLRNFMIEAGFKLFQESVWIYPYDCEDVVTLLKLEMRLGNSVRYGILEKLENDESYRHAFNLR